MSLDVASIFAWITALMQTYGPVSVFIAFIIEEIILPIPSPLVSMAAGYILIPQAATLVEAAGIAFFTIALPGSIAIALGSLVIYAVGYYGGERIVRKYSKFFGMTVEEIDRTSKKLGRGKKVWVSIALLRAIFIMPTSIVSVAAGFMRLDWKKFTAATFIGAIPRVFILSLIGWQIGSAYTSLGGRLSSLQDILFAAVVLVAVAAIYIFIKKRKRRSKKDKTAKK